MRQHDITRWDKAVLEGAINVYGEGAQKIVLFEELSELITSITRESRDIGDSSCVIEEIADVQIMLDQMKLIYGIEDVEDMVEAKMGRLAQDVEMAREGENVVD